MKRIANIHEAQNGTWHITDNALDYLDERGVGHGTERQAIKIARNSGNWTHRVTSKGKIVKL
jgi:hypothetical protein